MQSGFSSCLNMSIAKVPTIQKPDHSKSGSFCLDFKWLGFQFSDPIQNPDHFQPSLFSNIQNSDLSGFQIPTVLRSDNWIFSRTGHMTWMNVTSFSSISYFRNSEYWSQKHTQSGNIHSIILDIHVVRQSAHNFPLIFLQCKLNIS